METLANDFTGLPIIVSDWDAIVSQQKSASSSNTSSRSVSSPTSSTASTAAASSQKWHTGFSEVADALWSKLTTGMKQKVRDACVEVLRRTDDPSEEEKISWMYGDEDARFLD